MLKRGRVFTAASVPDAGQALHSFRSLIVNVITKMTARKRKARLEMALCIDLQARNSRRNLLSRCVKALPLMCTIPCASQHWQARV